MLVPPTSIFEIKLAFDADSSRTDTRVPLIAHIPDKVLVNPVSSLMLSALYSLIAQ